MGLGQGGQDPGMGLRMGGEGLGLEQEGARLGMRQGNVGIGMSYLLGNFIESGVGL